jgi:predicted phage terminase large subunit-like protein
VADYNKALHELRLTNGSLIKGIPASEPERFRGPQFHGGWLDELAAWEYLQEAWDQIQFGMRLKLENMKTRLICTTTPKPKDLIIDLMSREGDDVVLTTASTYANLDNLSENFKRQILSYEGTNLGRQEIHAEIIDAEEGGIVKRDWFRLWPADKPLPKLEFIVQSYDCAFTEKTQNDPTACITFGVYKPEDGGMRVLIIDAWQDRLQYPDLKPKVLDEYEIVFGEGKDAKRVDLVLVEDKAAGIVLIQDLQRAHIPVRSYNPGNADKIQRLSIVANIVKAGRVYVPESSVNPGFVRDWAEAMVTQICSFPQTTHDDFCVDSESLVMMADGSQKRICDVRVGEMVTTPNGSRRVLAVHDNGIKEVWKIKAADKSLLITGNHEVFTQKGWVRVDSLTQAIHNLYVINSEGIWDLQRNLASSWRQLSSMVENTTATLRARILRTVDTSLGLGTGFIEMCGSFITAQSQKGCTFTTSTATRPTTPLKTLNVLQEMPIGISTERSIQNEADQKGNLSILRPLDPKHQSGIGLKRAALGTESMLKNIWQKLGEFREAIHPSRLTAFGADVRCKLKAAESGSAKRGARLQNQSFASAKVVQNTRTMRRVYDLTIEADHCYFANGILVHNCDAFSQAIRYLRDAGWLSVDPPPRDDYDEDDVIDAGITKTNPYAA